MTATSPICNFNLLLSILSSTVQFCQMWFPLRVLPCTINPLSLGRWTTCRLTNWKTLKSLPLNLCVLPNLFCKFISGRQCNSACVTAPNTAKPTAWRQHFQKMLSFQTLAVNSISSSLEKGKTFQQSTWKWRSVEISYQQENQVVSGFSPCTIGWSSTSVMLNTK